MMIRDWRLPAALACILVWQHAAAAGGRDEVPVPPPNPFAGPAKSDVEIGKSRDDAAAAQSAPVVTPHGTLPVPPPRPRDLVPAPRPVEPTAPSMPAVPPADLVAGCLARLAPLDIVATAATVSPSPDPVCVVAVPVSLVEVGRRTLAVPVTIEGRPTLDCAMAERFGRFVREIGAPLAKGGTGTSLKAIVTGGYQCRPNNRMPSGHISAHATGSAIDIMAVRFADGRVADIGKPMDASTEAFVAGLRKAACGYFTTVLGPGTNAEHANHLHVDIMHHGTGADEHYRICQ